MVWEFIFLMLILKIPVIYLCLVVYWALKGDGGPAEGALLLAAPEVDQRPPWAPRARQPRRGPHGGPGRRYARVRRGSPART